MPFGRTQQAGASESGNANVANTATANSSAETGQGQQLLGQGTQAVNSGTNFFNSVLNGNRAAGAATLAPDINRIRDSNQNALQTASTLTPRGGGRTAALFSRPFAANDQVNGLYSTLRGGAAGNLAQIGQGQQGVGANLYGLGNQALNTSAQANTANLNYEQQRQQEINQAITGYANAGTRFLFG